MAEEKKEEKSLPIPVDRDWIAKLLEKYPNPNARRNDKALVVAPMVDQSDLPYRLLCRRYGANLCFTPMIHCKMLCTVESYRKQFLGTWVDADRPLIAQLAGSDLDQVLEAARCVEPYVDGIDINCGCPQGIARRGNYGAFLLEQEELLIKLVKYLAANLSVPVSVKVRLLPPPEHYDRTLEWDIPEKSLELYTKLVDAGAHMLTIHGRTRYQKTTLTGKSDWETIRRAVDLLGHRVPIIANGSVESYEDVEACLEATNADGVMSSEAILEFPAVFYKVPQTPLRTIGRIQLAQEYLDLARQYPPRKGGQGSGMKCIRTHIHRFLHADLQNDHDWRRRLVDIKSMEGFQECVDFFHDKHLVESHDIASEPMSWYGRHRTDPKVEAERMALKSTVVPQELGDDMAECLCKLFGDDVDECGEQEGDY